MRVGHASWAHLTGSFGRRCCVYGGVCSRRLRLRDSRTLSEEKVPSRRELTRELLDLGPRKPELAKNGAEVDRGIWEDARTHASSASHRASSRVTASTHPFEWVAWSPHASQSAPAHHSFGFSKESVIPGDDGHENRPSARPQRRTRAVVRARRGRDHHGSPWATRTMRPDARSGLMSPPAPTAPIPPCPEQCSLSIFRLVKKVRYDFWLVA